MKIKFWGVRGSIPTPFSNDQLMSKMYKILYLYNKSKHYRTKNIKNFLKEQPIHAHGTYGGNTACVEVHSNNELFIMDAGSGLRALGLDIIKRGHYHDVIHLFISHTHWDHICGFPFFVPAYQKGKKIIIYSPFKDIEKRFRYQQESRFFPIDLDYMAADFEFQVLKPKKPIMINGVKISSQKQNHPGDSYCFSIEHDNKKFVYSTDNEIFNTDADYIDKYQNFIKHADVLVFDAQYTLQETFEKVSWGHSSYTMGVEFALQTHVKNLVFFHYEPRNSDEVIFDHSRRIKEFYEVIKPNF
ncbi:MAG: MBL fold metallo-hydrolase, partial [Spirochaetes bacterium]|nr:MBL fold metallo-hydrolase [Spirochaetota bacterium]